MWGLFGRRRKDRSGDCGSLFAAQSMVAAYGRLLERRPDCIADCTLLPAPKDKFKAAIKLAWLITSSGEHRRSLEHGYLLLAQFQEGVGAPVSSTILPDMPLGEITKTLGNLLPWEEKAAAERQTLLAEWQTFVRKAEQP